MERWRVLSGIFPQEECSVSAVDVGALLACPRHRIFFLKTLESQCTNHGSKHLAKLPPYNNIRYMETYNLKEIKNALFVVNLQFILKVI
jgi:hypothetical protein